MAVAASPLAKSLRLTAASSSSSPTSRIYRPFVSLPCKHIKLSFLSLPTSWDSLKSTPLPVPLVAHTSDWAHQEEGEEFEQSEALTASYDGGEEAQLFVANLPYDIDSESLAQVFNRAGVVEIVEVKYNRETDQSRGFGFVTMSTVEEAEKAVEMFHGYELNGRLLTVNKAAPRGAQPVRTRDVEPSFRVYIGNLPWQVDDSRLKQVFSDHGKVLGARVVMDRESGRSRGFGFVTMSSETEVNNAIAALDGQSLDGWAVRVNFAESRPRRASF